MSHNTENTDNELVDDNPRVIRDKITSFVDPYVVLGVSKEDSDEKIRVRFLKLSLMHHPDKGGDAQKYAEIVQAYTSIKNKNSTNLMAKNISSTFDQIKQERRDLGYRKNDEFMVKDEQGKYKFDNDRFIKSFEEQNKATFEAEFGEEAQEHEQKCQKKIKQLLADRENETNEIQAGLQKMAISNDIFSNTKLFMDNNIFVQKEIDEVVSDDSFAVGHSILNNSYAKFIKSSMPTNKQCPLKCMDTRKYKDADKQERKTLEQIIAERNADLASVVNSTQPMMMPSIATKNDPKLSVVVDQEDVAKKNEASLSYNLMQDLLTAHTILSNAETHNFSSFYD